MHPSPPTASTAVRRTVAALLVMLLAMLLAASTLALLLAAPARAADSITVDDLTYSYNSDDPMAGATVVSCSYAVGPELVIPNSIAVAGTDYRVVAIGETACSARELTSIDLPDTLTTIEGAGFAGNNLTSVTLPDSVTSLGRYAFSGNELTSVTLSTNLTFIGGSAFQDNRLTSVTLPDSLTTIDEAAFYGNYLTSMTFPNSVTTIGNAAFLGNRLTSVTLSDNLTSIRGSAFESNQLTSITLPDSLTTLGHYAFANNHLRSVTLPDTLTILQSGAFAGNKLTSVSLPSSLTTLGDYVFSNNLLLTQVRFTGPAPATITASDQREASLGTAPGLTVAFHARHLGQTPGSGFTTPEWLGYTTLPAYTVTFDTRGGSPVSPETIWPGDVLQMPADPVRQDYTFLGWYATRSPYLPFRPQRPVTADITVQARWIPANTSASTSLGLGSLGS